MNDMAEQNPYQSPSVADDLAPPKMDSFTTARYKNTLQSFRTMMHLLGGFWIAISALAMLGTAILFSLGADPLVVILMVVACSLWLGLGIPTCMKQIWAVYVGLVLSYLSALSNLVQLNFCALTIVVPTIVIAHVVINKAGQLRRAGIPLKTTPRALALSQSPSNLFEGPNFDGIQFDD